MAARCPKIPGARFSEKNVLFLKFIGLVTPLGVLYPSEIMHLVFTESILARAVFARSIKVFKGQSGPQKPGITIFRKKKNVLTF